MRGRSWLKKKTLKKEGCRSSVKHVGLQLFYNYYCLLAREVFLAFGCRILSLCAVFIIAFKQIFARQGGVLRMSTDKFVLICLYTLTHADLFLTQLRGSCKCKSFLYVRLVDGGTAQYNEREAQQYFLLIFENTEELSGNVLSEVRN